MRKETKERNLTVQALVNHPYFANIVVVRSDATLTETVEQRRRHYRWIRKTDRKYLPIILIGYNGRNLKIFLLKVLKAC